ncbi:MAG: hypothetical protein J6X53_05565 [Abditibacteriota bacterium]|nr:hypothetical protein [Abditibacteriota bacterium]
MIKSLTILGTEYAVELKAYGDDPYFKAHDCCGYCDAMCHRIVVCDTHTYPDEMGEAWAIESEEFHEKTMKATLRHEIVHAYFDESGLQDCAAQYDGPYTKFEELIDWVAIQGPKIYQTWKEADAL